MSGQTCVPPAPRYELLPSNATPPGEKPPTIAYQRIPNSKLVDLHRNSPGVDADASHRAWLVSNGGKQTRLACQNTHTQTIQWSGLTSLRTAVHAHQWQIEQDFASMVRELRRANRLLADTAKTARPNIVVDVRDERADQRVELPILSTLLRVR